MKFCLKLNTCIEFNGRQNYEPVKYWGGIENFKKQQKRDKIKNIIVKIKT